MNQKTVTVNNFEINLIETSKKTQTKFFIHGISCSSRCFIKQFESNLSDKYHLIAIDLPGHGQSSRAADPVNQYTLLNYSKTIIEIVKNLSLEKTVIVGWSLGGHILIESLPELTQSMGILLFGTPPLVSPADLPKAFLPQAVLSAAFSSNPSEEEIEKYLSSLFKSYDIKVPEFFKEDFFRTDGNARSNLGLSLASGIFKNEVEIVQSLNFPISILHGEKDQVINSGYIYNLSFTNLWREKIFLIPDAGHTLHWEQPENFNSILDDFISEIQ